MTDYLIEIGPVAACALGFAAGALWGVALHAFCR